jgi:broad specificity phosphatase PhoE
MVTELILIRHGQAARTNGDYARAPLTALGREQAARTGQCLRDAQERIDGFYSSPLRRARETAVLIGSEIGRDPFVRNGLQEMMFFELLPIVILESLARFGLFHEYLYKNVGKPLHWPIVGRVSTVLTELIAHHSGESISIVTHGGVISGVLAWFLPAERRRWWRETVDNCSLTRLRVEGTAAELTLFNDTCHLKPQAAIASPHGQTAE